MTCVTRSHSQSYCRVQRKSEDTQKVNNLLGQVSGPQSQFARETERWQQCSRSSPAFRQLRSERNRDRLKLYLILFRVRSAVFRCFSLKTVGVFPTKRIKLMQNFSRASLNVVGVFLSLQGWCQILVQCLSEDHDVSGTAERPSQGGLACNASEDRGEKLCESIAGGVGLVDTSQTFR